MKEDAVNLRKMYDACPPKIGTIVKYLEPIPQLDGGCTPDIHVSTPGTPFQTEPECKLDK